VASRSRSIPRRKELPSPTEFRLLAVIPDNDERSGREIARAYEDAMGHGISYGTLYVTLERMRRQGWVTVREVEDSDRRVRYVQLTTHGKLALRHAVREYQALVRLGQLNPSLVTG
jgi:DNA-binding PadR family transcriptional regulator